MLITCEIVHWIRKYKKKGVIIKLDFKKFYDFVKRNFVDLTLERMGFGRRWRNCIKWCVSTTSMLVIINGSLTKPFAWRKVEARGPTIPLPLYPSG